MTPSTTTSRTIKEGQIEAIYVSPKSAAPMESLPVAKLIPGVGIEGDRYSMKVQTGTYSAKFLAEPGRQLTMMSAEGIEKAMQRTGMTPLSSLGDLRRNIVLRGVTAEALNEMVGHEVRIGKNSRVFVHRRTVPCKYREAACRRPGLLNNLWGVCGVNCEVLPPLKKETESSSTLGDDVDDNSNEIRVGDTVAVIPDTFQPERINMGRKPPAFFIRPADRSAEDVKQMIKPPFVVMIMCLIDPEGFQRLEDGYNSAGQRFWSAQAYSAGLLVKTIRTPFLVTVLSIVIGVALYLQGITF